MKKIAITILILGLIGFGVYNKIYLPKHTFKTTQATKGSMAVKIHGIGEVESKNYYKIGSIYSGQILDFTLNEGDFIKKGTVIAHIDSIDLKNKINELKATINKLTNDIQSLEVDQKSAQVTSQYQDEILKKNQQLYKKGAISALDLSKFQTNATTAYLKIKSINAKLKSLANQKKQLYASLNGLKQKLKRFTIISPINGYIVKKYISNYTIVNPNQTIIQIVNPDDIWVATYIDTRISGEIKQGDKATIKLRSSTKQYKAKVVNIKPINNNVTYEREVDVAFDNLPIPFYLQEQATVEISIKNLKNIVKVPTKALTIYQKQEGVWIVKNHKVNFRPLNILAYSDNNIATKDLTTKDILVIPDPKKKTLQNGMKINEQ